VLAAGFPIVLALAWYHDLRGGLRRFTAGASDFTCH
jgi:hypothetical protein